MSGEPHRNPRHRDRAGRLGIKGAASRAQSAHGSTARMCGLEVGQVPRTGDAGPAGMAAAIGGPCWRTASRVSRLARRSHPRAAALRSRRRRLSDLGVGLARITVRWAHLHPWVGSSCVCSRCASWPSRRAMPTQRAGSTSIEAMPIPELPRIDPRRSRPLAARRPSLPPSNPRGAASRLSPGPSVSMARDPTSAKPTPGAIQRSGPRSRWSWPAQDRPCSGSHRGTTIALA